MSGEQGSLFDRPPAAGKQYPYRPGAKTGGTSQQAADKMVAPAKSLRDRVYSLLVNTAHGLTADECAERLGERIWSVRPRLTELNKQLKIHDSGLRRQNESGVQAIVWRA